MIMIQNPDNPHTGKQDALALYQQGKYAEALSILTRIVEGDPADNDAHYLLGMTHLQLYDYSKAEFFLQKVLDSNSHHAGACFGMALAVGARGNIDEAAGYLKNTLDMEPNNLDARVRLGAIHQIRGQHYEAIRQYKKVLGSDPDHLEGRLRMGNTHLDLGELDKAASHYRNVLADNPDETNAITGLAAIYVRKNQYQNAYRIIRPVLEKNTDSVRIAVIYADICHHFDDCQDAIELMERLEKSNTLAFDMRTMLLFALGKLHDKVRNYSHAFHYYQKGNELMPSGFDPWEAAQELDESIKFWNNRFMTSAPRSRKQNKHKRPVFIVGMPRSGTSLVEQILSSHPSVYAAGELQDIPDMVATLPSRLGSNLPYPACLGPIDQKAIDELARTYLKKLETISEKHDRVVTDKMPLNYLYLGLIQLLFPKARIIHCVRDPLDTCLSCYFQNFAGVHDYSYNLQHAGQYYLLYKKLMRHWKNVLGLKILDVTYEDLVVDPEINSRRIVDFCGLKWDEKCLEYYKTKRAIVTSSYDQASQPIYHHSIKRWKHYERYLDPLKKALQL